MIQKPNNIIKELLVVALITSVFFGIFSVLPMLLTSGSPFNFQPSPPRNPEVAERVLRGVRDRPMRGFSVNILVTTLLMLTLWLMNIILYARLQALEGKERVKNIVRYCLSYALMFGLISLYYFTLGQLSIRHGYGRALFVPFIAGLTNNTIVIIILDLVVLQRKKAQVELENAQLKMSSIQAQHQHLKHQLQPHFLFNSLNTLKTLIKRHPLEAEDYLVRLSEFLRASLTADNKDIVALRDELKLCTDYLEMQKVRFKNAFNYEVEIPDEWMDTAFLPVFSLQLLVENAIKHNGFTNEEPLHILISYQGSGYLKVRNNKKQKLISEPSSGIGLKNLKERYQVLSDKQVSVTDAEDYFSVQLPILSK
ncbi:histidine kinase [uncultured Pontibacter sp.]|uniref:sensor histidine kinase n=1 Tax=uncultured Pontibacter sp. TaxID=453356 RepID=UPI0026090B4C|nr:histidine kinase [uncultured Pontibacter sp.]